MAVIPGSSAEDLQVQADAAAAEATLRLQHNVLSIIGMLAYVAGLLMLVFLVAAGVGY